MIAVEGVVVPAFAVDVSLIKKKRKSAVSCGDKMTCIKLGVVQNLPTAGYTRAKSLKIAPTDIFAEEGPVFAFDAFISLPHIQGL